MGRVIGLVEVRHVAANASGRGAHEFAAGMAGGAVESGVRSDQGKASKFEVIKPRAHPVVHGVALFTGGGKIQGHVVQSGGFRVDEISLVTGHTHRRKTLELAYCGALVTGVAGDSCVRTNQGEAIQVLIDLLDGNIPALYCVALLAVGAHLAFVDICVTGRALRAYIREDWLGVALSAGHTLVHAAQRILGGVVIEFWYGADRLPAAQRVAILARDTEASMRTARVGGRLRLATPRLSAGNHRKCD
jgi:hypothetical protein